MDLDKLAFSPPPYCQQRRAEKITPCTRCKKKSSTFAVVWNHLQKLAERTATCSPSIYNCFLKLLLKYKKNFFKSPIFPHISLKCFQNVAKISWELSVSKFFWNYLNIFSEFRNTNKFLQNFRIPFSSSDSKNLRKI